MGGNNAFAVPTQYGGMSLKDIFGKVSGAGGYTPDLGSLSSLTGLNADTPLTAGQTVTFNKDDPNSGEYKFLSSNFTPYSQYQSDQFNNFYNTQEGDINDYLSRLQSGTAANQAKSYGDFNVIPLQNAASQIQQRLDLLRTNANNTGAGGYASQNQVNQAGTNLSTRGAIASNAASNAANAANNEYQNLMTPLTTEGTMLNDQLTRAATGFTQDQQNQLDLLTTQLNNGEKLTENQMNQANALALQEQKYQQALNSPNYQIQQLGGSYYAVDMNNPSSKVYLGAGNAAAGTSGNATLNTGPTTINNSSASLTPDQVSQMDKVAQQSGIDPNKIDWSRVDLSGVTGLK